jgi:hypothetical protein
MKRLLAIAAAVALVGSAVGVVAANGKAGDKQTLRLGEKITDVHRVDAAPKGDSPGDTGVISGELSSAGKKVGRYQGYCVTVRPPDTSDCTFTLSLPKGQLKTTAGYGPGFNGQKVVHEAVLGGTHAYRAAGGEVISRETGDTTGKLTIHLTK